MPARNRLGTAALAIALASPLACARKAEPPPALEVLGTLPPFAFTDQHGQRFDETRLAGRISVVNFVFTRCPTVCPVVTLKMKRFEAATADLGDKLVIASFSVDPEYDTPVRLKAYAERFQVASRRWSFVTGPANEMTRQVESSLKIALDRRGETNGVPNILHGTHFVLLDRDLNIRGYYDSDDAGRLAELERDARALAAAPQGTVVGFGPATPRNRPAKI